MSFDEGSGGRGNGSLSVVVSDEDGEWVLTLRDTCAYSTTQE